MYNYCFIYFILLLIIINLSSCEKEVCNARDPNEDCLQNLSDSSEHDDETPHHKYDEGQNTHTSPLQHLHAAQQQYHPPCRNCSCFFSQLRADLEPHRHGISRSLLEQARQRGTLYQVIDGQLYRDEACLFPSRCAGVEHFLLQVIEKLPNTEFVVNVRDWPQVNKPRQKEQPLPVFSFSKNTEAHADILYPAWAFWEGGPAISLHPTGLGRWDLRRASLAKAAAAYPWRRKEATAFFRGSRTSSSRDALVRLSRRRPHLVEARYTRNQAWRGTEDTLGAQPAEEVSLENHCPHKYLFNFRGVAASFRFKHLFLCGSLVFHEEDDWIEFFYPQLRPWEHYIPFPRDSGEGELARLVEFARDHDEAVRGVAEAGRRFVKEHLRMKDVVCYWRKLLKSYAKLLKYEVGPREGLVRVLPKRGNYVA